MNIPELDPDYCIEKQIFRHSRKNNALYLTATLAVLAALLSLPFLKVDILVRGVGVIRPITEKVELKAPVGETIAEIFAHEGSILQKGDTILLLNTASIDASLINQRSLLQDLENQEADLLALCMLKQSMFLSEKRQQENNFYLRQKEEISLSIESANQKLKRNEALFKTGVIPRDEFENYQHEKQRYERELKTLQENRLSLWKSDLNELARQQEETVAAISRLEHEKTLYALTAPIQGSLEQFSGLYPGGHLYSGQSIGLLSPDSTLIVEAYIPPKNIGFLQTGMPVRISIEAYDYNLWGFVQGQISTISSDCILTENTPFYKVKCRLDKPFLTLKNRKRGYLKKGMSVQTRFLVNRRSLFQLIYEKMDDWANPQNI